MTEFFAAGGDSLSAGQLVSRLRHEFGIFLVGDILLHDSAVGDLEHNITRSLRQLRSRLPRAMVDKSSCPVAKRPTAAFNGWGSQYYARGIALDVRGLDGPGCLSPGAYVGAVGRPC